MDRSRRGIPPRHFVGNRNSLKSEGIDCGITADGGMQVLLVALLVLRVNRGARRDSELLVAIAGAFMIGRGFKADFMKLALNLIANTEPVARGAIGTTGCTSWRRVRTLPESDPNAMTGRILPSPR